MRYNFLRCDESDGLVVMNDEMTTRVLDEERRYNRGNLKIFFGAAAGVGKTYSMLDAARERKADGVDVVVGCIDSHGRTETAGLVEGLEVLPPLVVEANGVKGDEFDLDAALKRRPTLILIDELAHANALGMRHPKRWQDVEELLEAGIHVYTTVNVQHLESLNDIVKQITGVVVQDTIPDRLLEQANDVELVDLSLQELLERLHEGKVYIPAEVEQALNGFFRPGNLMALRELALRRTADRVDAQMRDYRRDHAIEETWPATERLLVCVSASPLSARLVRATKRMADGLHGEWIAVCVETPYYARLSEKDRNRLTQNLNLAEQLGAKTVILSGHDPSEEIIVYARAHNISKIIVGKPIHPRWLDLMKGSFVDELVRQSGDIDVYIIRGEGDNSLPEPVAQTLQSADDWRDYLKGLTIIAICTLIAGLMFRTFEPGNISMVYLLGIMIVSAVYGRGPALLVSLVSIALFDFFFVPPYLTFVIADAEYLVTFPLFIGVALVVSTLTERVWHQADDARQRERRTAALYEMSRELARTRQSEHLANVASRHMGGVFDAQVTILLPDAERHLKVVTEKSPLPEMGVVDWVYGHGQAAGLGTQTLPSARGIYLPLVASHGTMGVLGVYPVQLKRFDSPDQFHLLETFATQATLAIERAYLASEAEQTRLQVETERLRNTLLSSISHDLRTPLASITGAASGLLQENESTLNPAYRHELSEIIYEEATRLNRLVGNLLDMTRLESGGVRLRKEWYPLEEIVGTTINRLENQLQNRSVMTKLPDDLPPVQVDSVLIEQVLTNLVENAVKYTEPNTPITLSAWADDKEVTVEVADQGVGLPAGEEERIFDKFYRAQHVATARGVGLGLTICRGIIEAHGGRIWAMNRSEGGAAFRFTLPLEGTPPEVAALEEAVEDV
jgi:two-component system, OmpR family, sensor histidine kinase KdpD